VPEGITKDRIQQAMQILSDELHDAIQRLGTGSEVTAQGTVPFCLWSAAHHLDNFEDALCWTAKDMGNCDTTCAIVGGIVALSAPEIPALWLKRRERYQHRWHNQSLHAAERDHQAMTTHYAIKRCSKNS
jgi:ADP-ribosylglycohydrolase